MTGGTDSATGLAFTGVLTAPTGSTQVTPLTTLVQSVAAANGGNVAAAIAAVASALGLDPNTDLTTLDTVAAAYAGNSQAFVAASSVLNTVSMVASAVAGTGKRISRTAATNAFSALASQIVTLSANHDARPDQIRAWSPHAHIEQHGHVSSATLTSDQTDGIVTVVTSVNTATNQAAATAAPTEHGRAADQRQRHLDRRAGKRVVAAATKPTARHRTPSQRSSGNSGTNLTSSVSQPRNGSASVAPAPPTCWA